MEKPKAEKTYRILKGISIILYISIVLNKVLKPKMFMDCNILVWHFMGVIGSLIILIARVGSYFLGNPLAVVSVIFMIYDIRKKHGLWKKWLVLAILFFTSKYLAYNFFGEV